MGDAGSLALGFFYGLLVIEAWIFNPALGFILIIPGLIPFLEVGFLMVQRTQKRIPFYRTTPDHFALRMLHNGRCIRQIIVPVALVAVGLTCLASALVIVGISRAVIVASIVLLVAGTLWANRYFSRLPVREPAE
jgi:UDP-N-acetylmuramyl pentapeptide phosphotransferase/UDP-N-acetylglucosamine-1-phosphate transferase